jgi:hypothetical protein
VTNKYCHAVDPFDIHLFRNSSCTTYDVSNVIFIFSKKFFYNLLASGLTCCRARPGHQEEDTRCLPHQGFCEEEETEEYMPEQSFCATQKNIFDGKLWSFNCIK